MSIRYEALALFLALVGLYSPVAALSSYLPVVRPFDHGRQMRLAIGLVLNVAVFVLAAIWIGDPLLELLGISPAALTATGGIALIFASVPMMRGTAADVEEEVAPAASAPAPPVADKRNVLFTPITFPLTVGGATFAISAAASADVGDNHGRLLLSIAAVAYGLVTGVTLYAAGHVERRISPAASKFLDRIAGILLTAIAVILLSNGFTDLVLARAGRG
ncbi:MarC family protein [Actinoplanes sp. CA-030573]|uniref:MarC family protein n=1 Tax=Actinoplanes sp. CA-030573 TaxID=3239898 RepID=UPI003D8B1BAE